MGPLFAAVGAAIFLSSCARGDVSNSYLPTKSSSGPRWSGALAVPMILSDGTIAETAEVAAARAAHLAALEAARASDPDMGQDDGEYDPQKYGDHLYGIEAHSEDLLQSIHSYNVLAKSGGAPALVYGASTTGAGGAASGATPAPVYGAPAVGGGAAASRATPALVYGAPAVGADAAAIRAAPAPVYGAPAVGAGEAASRATPASVYGAPAVGAGAAASRATPASVYGAPAVGADGAASRAVPASAYGAPAVGAGAAASRAAPVPVFGAPYQAPAEQSTPYTGPLAMLQLLASGYLAETPEVVAARSTHLKAFQEAQAAAALWRARQTAAGGNQAHPWS